MVWITLAIITICIIIATFLILPPSLGKMPLFYDENGNVLMGSISERTYLNVEGVDLGLFITGKDVTNPVLLFLAGGPGIPEYLLEQEYPTHLTNEFVVCYIEYRGTSISYHSNMKSEQMTTKQYISDVVHVTKYLQERFVQEKLYLLGHSFGTYLGLSVVNQYPELYYAYVAMSQITNQPESEKIAYQYMINEYRKAGNNRMEKKFEAYPIFTSDKILKEYSKSFLRDQAMHKLGIGTTRDMHSITTGLILPSLRSKIYTPIERFQIWKKRGFINASPVATDWKTFNAFDEITSIQIPVYFLGGIYDYTCCYSLQKDYYEVLKAPIKGFYTFNNSAHSPLFEEPEKTINILIKDVLRGSNTLSN